MSATFSRGGRAFVEPLPIILGTNGAMVDYGEDPNGISWAQAIGMQVYRNEVPWNFVKGGGFTGVETTPGTYNTDNIATVASVAATIKAAGITPLFVITVNSNAGNVTGMCPTLTAALTSGNIYTSINISGNNFAITIGDSIVLTNPSNQSQTQTITAAANMVTPSGGSLTVSAFTANHNYGTGNWVYDTTWNACTPQHFATMAAYLVAQSGLQGLNWELLNEPDGNYVGSFGIAAPLLTQTYKLAYPAMKAADPTCTIHGLVLESLAGAGGVDGTDYYNSCVASGIVGNYDAMSVHTYGINADYTDDDAAPDAIGGYHYTMPQLLGNFRAVMLSHDDNVPIWITEWGWQDAGGAMTPQLQAQYFQNYLQALSGRDPINGGLFSSYLKVMCQFELTGGYEDWGIIPDDEYPGTPNPAVAVLTKMVAGH